MIILINLGLKEAATRFPIVLLQDVPVLLQDALFYYRKPAEILGDGREGRVKCGKVYYGEIRHGAGGLGEHYTRLS